MLPDSASEGGGICQQPVTLDSLNFLFSHVFRRRATNTFETQTLFGCRERNLALERVCVVPILQYLRGHGRQVQQWPHAMQCQRKRSICHMLGQTLLQYNNCARAAEDTQDTQNPKLTSLLTEFRKW